MVPPDPHDRPGARGGHSPRALVVTIYGLFARDVGGRIGVAALIRLMAAFLVDEQAVRSLISRLKRRGILRAERIGGTAGYGLSSDGRRLLDAGDRRIFDRPRARLSDGWLLAVFSVPETERARRHTLRSRLTRLGFGTVSAGVWIAPAYLFDETVQVLRHEGLTPYVEVFRGAEFAGDLAGRVRSWWDLDGLAAMYRAFVADHRPVLDRWTRGPADDATAFVDYVGAVTAWRRLPYLDPGLPVEVLPADWPGTSAAALFGSLGALLAGPAGRHVATAFGIERQRNFHER